VSMDFPVPQVAKSNRFTLPDDRLREAASLRVSAPAKSRGCVRHFFSKPPLPSPRRRRR
jgi:hypothetical protein